MALAAIAQAADIAPGTGPRSNVAAVSLQGISKQFRVERGRDAAPAGGPAADSILAVASIDLEIHDGEFFSMLGPSGSGKTTTLRMIAGFEQPTAGRILLHGEDVTNLPPFERDVNTVFQDYALFPHMTVGENVAYGLDGPQDRSSPSVIDSGGRRPADGPPGGLRRAASPASCPAVSVSGLPSPAHS